jgi:lipopolysaccharide export system protein LptA
LIRITHIYTLIFFLFGLSITLNAQDKKKINIEYAGRLNVDEENYPGAKVLTRNSMQQVHIVHAGSNMWCDKAIYYSGDNFVEAYGNVIVKQGDTITMTSKYVEYSGSTQLAFASGEVVLKSPNSTISTDTLYFDRVKQQSFYKSGGNVVKDSSGTITSKIGRYYMNDKKFQFVEDVVLTGDGAVVNSNYFDFYEDTGLAYLFGPSTITTKESKTYCEKGFYDTKNKTGYALKESKIYYDDRIIEGDSLYFDNTRSFASASNNIKITDTINNSIVTGHYAEVFKAKDSLFITKRALVTTVQEKDSVYLHADKIMVTGKPEHRITRAFYKAKLYKTDISAKADSIHADQKTGLTEFINLSKFSSADAFSTKRRPILWNNENQMTGDTIHLISNSKTEKLDSLRVFNNAFIISKDTLSDNGYNQIFGITLVGLFNDANELRKVNINKNAESIFYSRNEKQELIGIDKAKSGSINMLFSDGDIEEYTRLNTVDGTLFPEKDYQKKDKFLKGFDWREDERPLSVEDLFKDDEPFELPIIKGLADYVPQEDFFDEKLLERINQVGQKDKAKYTIQFNQLTLKGGTPFTLTKISKSQFNIVKTAGKPTSVVMGIYIEFDYDDLKDLDKTYVLDLQKKPKSENLNLLKIVKGITDWNPINYPISLTYKDGNTLINLYEIIMASSEKNIDYYSRANSLQLLVGYFNSFDLSASTNTILDYNITMYLK